MELADVGLDEEDALHILSRLRPVDLAGRIESKHTPEWLYVFKPEAANSVFYVKLILRTSCVVISFHEDQADGDEET